MPMRQDEVWFDDEAGRLVRPYTVSNGRTKPSFHLDMLSVVATTGQMRHDDLGFDHAQVLDLCYEPISVVEVSAHMRLPVSITKVLLADLVECRALTAHHSGPPTPSNHRSLLKELLDGLQRRL
jgi:hypothetical protein